MSRPGWAEDIEAGSAQKRGLVWGEVGFSTIFTGSRMAPNGVEYDPLFVLTTDFNVGLNSDRTLYLFTEDRFWAQEATPGVTNSNQGSLDFSKREYDLKFGVGWRYRQNLELRGFAYSFNNLNRGNSDTAPSGYKDGVGIENRFHFGAADNYVGVGYYFTKDLVDQAGVTFKPGFFLSACLHAPIVPKLLTAAIEPGIICEESGTPKLLDVGLMVSVTPFKNKDIHLGVGIDTVHDFPRELSRSITYFRVSLTF